jgi:hypothetical protein
MKKMFFIITLLSSIYSFGQECSTFNFKKTLSGSDFVNFKLNPKLEVCEYNKTIEIGTKTFYILRSIQNSYGDYFYGIKEAQGYGWPEIGHVKIASNFEIVELKIMNSIVKYSLISPYEMGRIEKETEIVRERQQNRQREEESIKVQADKNKYPSIDILINEKKFKEAYVLVNKLYSPSNYPKATLIKNALLDSDKSLNNTINEYAKNGDYVKAFQSFDLLNFKEQYTFNLDDWRTIQEDLLIAEYKKRRVNSLSSLVKNYLIDKYKDYSEELPIEKINQLIKDNKINLSKLNSGSYDLKITNTGKILIDNKDVSKEFSYTKSIKIFHDEFDIYINEYSKLIIKDSLEKFKNSGATGNLTLVEYKLNPKHQNTSVYFKKNENKELNFYCDKSMLVETLKKSRKDLNYIGGDGNKITYDSRISKKSIKYSVIENKVKYVNGIIVNKIPGLYNWIDKELIIKRHIVKKITIAALFGGLMYLTSNY